ncbi:MAG: PAS domain S-box protein [Gallionella sp.]|nr:PAS domain S-box protein [Gallionella sp.]
MNTLPPYQPYNIWQRIARYSPARDSFTAYLIALALVGLAVLLRLAFASIDAGYQYITLFPAVALAAVVGGFWPGMLAAVIGALCAQFFLTAPYYAFSVESLETSFWSVAVFLVDALIVCSSIEAMHRYRAKSAAELEELQQKNQHIQQLHRDTEMLLLRSQSLMSNSMDGIHVLDTHGNIIMANDAFCRMLGYTQEEVATLNITDWDVQFSANELRLMLNNFSGKGVLIETQHRRKNGEIRNVEVSVTGVLSGGITVIYASARDITDRKKIEQHRLQESDLRFRGTLEQAAVGIAHASLDGGFAQINQKFCDIVGYSREELLNMSFQDITYPADLGGSMHYLQQLLAGKVVTFSLEKRYIRKDGNLVWVNLTASLLRQPDGIPAYFIGVIEDITERKQHEFLVRQFGSLLKSSFNEIYIFDASTLRFLQTSSGADKNLGYSSDELRMLTPLDIKPQIERERFELMLALLRSGKQESLLFETVHLRKNGTTYPVEVRMQFMESDSPVYIAVVQDISERKRADKQLRDLSSHLQTVREEEKASMAREIHDNLGGTLTALKMDVYWLADELSAYQGAAPLLKHVNTMSRLLDDAVDVTRRVITDLRPTLLDDLGLLAALEWQAGQFQKRSGIKCRVSDIMRSRVKCRADCSESCTVMPDKIQSINLFRIFQESLTNVARHSGASNVDVELRIEAGNLTLSIADNGCGIPAEHVASRTSYGMLGMRERVAQLGGEIYFSGAPDSGLCVTVILPLRTDRQTGEANDTCTDC